MITEMSVSNFKSIEKIESLKLKPLTLLTGVNSSGKSNIIEAISFFAQAARLGETPDGGDAPVNLVNIYRYGDVKKYPRPIENFVIHKKNKSKLAELEVNIKPEKSAIKEFEDYISRSLDKRLKAIRKIGSIDSVGYSFQFRLTPAYYSQEILINKEPILAVYRHRRRPIRVSRPERFRGNTMKGSPATLFNDKVFTPVNKAHLEGFSVLARRVLRYVRDSMKKTYFISGERGRIDAELPVSTEQEFTPSWIGPYGQYLVEILSRCLTLEPEKTAKIQEWAKKFQLLDVRAGYIGRGLLQSTFKDRKLDVTLNSTLAGLGSRQILSIVTQIFWSEPGSVIMIEEPEISLHPENQVLLHELFSEAISQGKQIVCSTHSPFFVLALSKAVKKKLLRVDDIAVYHVEKGDNGTITKPLKLNEQGFIVSGVPSFMKVEEDLFRDWSESLGEE